MIAIKRCFAMKGAGGAIAAFVIGLIIGILLTAYVFPMIGFSLV